MARPQKKGLDYFPLDVALDSKFELIEAEFGLKGFVVVVKLLQYIYGESGYYCEWTKEVELLFSRKLSFPAGDNSVSEIVNASIRRGMFDKNLYDKYQVLTSNGIQKRYFEAVNRRKEIEVNEHILLVNVAQICPKVYINKVNVNINSINAYINSQSKVKESKVKKTTLGAAREESVESNFLSLFWNAYPKKKNKGLVEVWFKKNNPSKQLIDKILVTLQTQKQTEQWNKDNGQFIPYPINWLTAKGWEDEDNINPSSQLPQQPVIGKVPVYKSPNKKIK